MSRLNSRNKGASGEREAAKWLQDQFGLSVLPERNLEQVRSGGFDLTGFPPFALEIKRCEKIDRQSWWVQAVASVTPSYCVPVVMFRQNRGKWRFLISAKEVGARVGYMDISDRVFKDWVKVKLESRREEWVRGNRPLP